MSIRYPNRAGRSSRFTVRVLALLTFAAAPLGCGSSADDECPGSATSVNIKGPDGGPGTIGRSLCADANSGLLKVRVNEGSLASFQVEQGLEGSGTFESGTYTCESDAVRAQMDIHSDKEADPNGYATIQWQANPSLDGSSCTLTIGSGEKSGEVNGTFTGKLVREKLSGEKEFLEVSFQFSAPTNAQ